jgi:hypothetical protein
MAGSDFTIQTAPQASETFAKPTTAGNSIVVLGFWGAPGYPATLTDTAGNTYASTSVVSNSQPGQEPAAQIFYAPRIAGGTNTVTLKMGGGFDSYVGLAIFEYEGLAGGDTLVGSAGQAAPMATAGAYTPAVQTSSGETLLFAGFADMNGTGQILPGPGWTALTTNTQFFMMVETQVVSTKGAFSAPATMPLSDNRWVALLAAFQGGP